MDVENIANKYCKNYKKLFEKYFIKDDLYIGFIIPEVIFEKDDFGDAFKRNFFANYSSLSKNILFRDHLFLTTTDLIQDDGFFSLLTMKTGIQDFLA